MSICGGIRYKRMPYLFFLPFIRGKSHFGISASWCKIHTFIALKHWSVLKQSQLLCLLIPVCTNRPKNTRSVRKMGKNPILFHRRLTLMDPHKQRKTAIQSNDGFEWGIGVSKGIYNSKKARKQAASIRQASLQPTKRVRRKGKLTKNALDISRERSFFYAFVFFSVLFSMNPFSWKNITSLLRIT